MNPTQTAQRPTNLSPENMLERAFDMEQPEPFNDAVSHSEQDLKSIRSDWIEFMSLKTEVNEAPATKVEVSRMAIEAQFSQPLGIKSEESKADIEQFDVYENQKGSGSIFEEAGLKLDFPGLGKEIGKGLFGALGIFKEIFMDTVALFIDKKAKKTEKPETDAKKAEEKAKKEALKQKRKMNWGLFNQALSAQVVSTPVAAEAVRMDVQEKSNINLTAKIGQESYKGIKDAFGRLTIYAASLFEKAQMDQEKKAKKQEKDMKIASVKGKPDLSLDKAAEGGFLSATGGQGAG